MRARVVGICGGSGSGKTTLTRLVVGRLRSRGGPDAGVLAFDSYYLDLSHLPMAERSARNYDHPDALDVELFASHLDALRGGRGVSVPVYDFATHTASGEFRRVEPAPVLLAEGILLLAFPEIESRLDFSVFLDVPETVRLQRRIRRDTVERGRRPDDVRRQFRATVAPMHDRYVQPSSHRADRIAADGEDLEALAHELLAVLSAPVAPSQMTTPSRANSLRLRSGP